MRPRSHARLWASDTGPDLSARLRELHLDDLPIASQEGRRIGRRGAAAHHLCVGAELQRPSARDAGLPVPPEPILFNKAGAAFCGPEDPIPFAPGMTRLDWEVELGVVIGAPALGVTPDRRWRMWRAMSWSTTCPNAPGRWTARGNG